MRYKPPARPTTLRAAQDYDLIVHCRRCRHWWIFTVEQLAKDGGLDQKLDDLAKRMRCDLCKNRDATVNTTQKRTDREMKRMGDELRNF